MFRRFWLNKRGDVSTTILVIGVFIVCTLALLNFYVAGLGDEGIFESVSLVTEIGKFAGDVMFYQNLDKDALLLADNSKIPGNKDISISASENSGHYSIEGNLSKKDYFFFNERVIAYVEYDLEP